MLIGLSWAPKIPKFIIGNQIWSPLGKEDVCPNFALTVGNISALYVVPNSVIPKIMDHP